MRTLVPNGDFPERGEIPLTFDAPVRHIHELGSLSLQDEELAYGVKKSEDSILSAHMRAGVILTDQIDLLLEDL